MGTPAGRLLYLALADARGHLMRAHLLSGVLGEAGLAVDIVTTSREGARFLASMGRSSTPSSRGRSPPPRARSRRGSQSGRRR